MLKRGFDLLVAIPAALLTAPIVAVLMLAIWWYDRGSPLYVPRRIGQHGNPFPLFKLRTMVVGADRTGVDTTIRGDVRLLPFAATLRRYKLDELPQFWNVILGQMSLVGPRPNVQREVDKYSAEERRLLSVKPGLTDFASIVFSDLGDRLAGQQDANQAYETMIRPAKSRLGLFYVDNSSIGIDLILVVATGISLISKPAARRWVSTVLARHGAGPDLIEVVAKG